MADSKQSFQSSSGWPTVTYEELPWEPSSDAMISRRQRLLDSGPYQAAVTPEIAAIKTIKLSTEILSLCDDASTEIARFDAELGSEIAPFAAILLRSESAASSKIENLTASAKAIALAEVGDSSKHNANIIVANTRSMEAAIALANHLDAQAILDMHQALLEITRPEWTGHWRTKQVWIGGSNYGPHSAMFVPPQPNRVPRAIDDLVAFLRRDDLPPLIQTAIAHAQFETIHPFPDGNGRTGRSLVHALLRSKRLTRNITVPVSAGLLIDTNRYFDALSSYRQGDIQPIIELIANASYLAIDNGRQLVNELREIRQSWDTLIQLRRGSTVWKLADFLIRQPVVDSPLVQRELGVAATNVNSALDHLEKIGVVKNISGNYRNRKWAANSVLTALDDFAERAGRRQ